MGWGLSLFCGCACGCGHLGAVLKCDGLECLSCVRLRLWKVGLAEVSVLMGGDELREGVVLGIEVIAMLVLGE